MFNRSIFFVLILFSQYVHAQVSGEISDKMSRNALAQKLIDQYKVSVGGENGKKTSILEDVKSLGLVSSEKNLKLIESSLMASNSPEERVNLVRIMGDFYSKENSKEKNLRIRKNLQASMQDGSVEVASAAILSYSRMGYFDDSLVVLKQGFLRKKIDRDTYGAELAHLIWYAESHNQNLVLSEIENNNTEYARRVFNNNLSKKMLREKIASDSKKNILNFLLANEPKFSISIGEFSMVEAFAYSDWLHSIAVLINETQPESYERVIFRSIGQVTSNPKKTIAFLISDEGKAYFSSAPTDEIKVLLDKINDYSDNLPYPQSSTVKELVSVINHEFNF